MQMTCLSSSSLSSFPELFRACFLGGFSGAQDTGKVMVLVTLEAELGDVLHDSEGDTGIFSDLPVDEDNVEHEEEEENMSGSAVEADNETSSWHPLCWREE